MSQVMVEALKYLHKIQKCKYTLLMAITTVYMFYRVILKQLYHFVAIDCLLSFSRRCSQKHGL